MGPSSAVGRVGVRRVALAGKAMGRGVISQCWSRVCGSFAKGPGIGLFARKFSASRFQKGDDMRGEGAPKIEAVILIAIPPEDG
ncbi:hypothetical protein SAMN02744133_11751 [Thalassospira xiamenensis M-5 = DSM 17429]|nr:hypothetical protein SAMN02744133_11751 [Thalassospira xiamenensis M-5 = DSM 17429]